MSQLIMVSYVRLYLACTFDNLRVYSISLHNFRPSSVLFGDDASRLGILYLVDCESRFHLFCWLRLQN